MAQKIYGVEWDITNSNPTLTRTDNAIGMTAAAGVDMNVVSNDFDYAEIFKDIHRVEYKDGNVFQRIPKIWIEKTKIGNKRTIRISKKKFGDARLRSIFWDPLTGEELPYFDFGAFNASLSADNKLESKPDRFPLVGRNIVDFRIFAKNNGQGYQQLDLQAVDVLQCLFRVEFATLNSQAVMQGWTTGQYNAAHVATVSETATNRIIVANSVAALYAIGQPIAAGTIVGANNILYGRLITAIEDYDANNKAIVFDGAPANITAGNVLINAGWPSGFSRNVRASSGSIASNSNGKFPCCYRGIENPWGSIWNFVDGVNINEYQAWVCNDAADYASNLFAHPYKQLGYTNWTENGYVKEMGFDYQYQEAEFPVAIGAASNTYYSDYYYQNTGQRIALLGAGWYSGVVAGVSFWSLYHASSGAGVNFGGRLLKKAL